MYLELYGSAICKHFLFPESNDPPKITTPLKLRPPKAANSESNEGRYYRNSTVSFFVPEIFKFPYYANLVIDDVIGCASTVVWHKIKKISANNEAMLLKLGRDVSPYEIYQMVHILIMLW